MPFSLGGGLSLSRGLSLHLTCVLSRAQSGAQWRLEQHALLTWGGALSLSRGWPRGTCRRRTGEGALAQGRGRGGGSGGRSLQHPAHVTQVSDVAAASRVWTPMRSDGRPWVARPSRRPGDSTSLGGWERDRNGIRKRRLYSHEMHHPSPKKGRCGGAQASAGGNKGWKRGACCLSTWKVSQYWKARMRASAPHVPATVLCP